MDWRMGTTSILPSIPRKAEVKKGERTAGRRRAAGPSLTMRRSSGANITVVACPIISETRSAGLPWISTRF